MGLIGFLVLNQEGAVLLSRYVESSVESSALATFERKLLRSLIFSEVDYLGYSTRQFLEVSSYSVALQQIGDLVVILVGWGDADEMVLSSLLDTTLELLRDQLGGKFTERVLLNSENYGKLMLALDEFAPHGIVETTDVDAIGRFAKMK